MSLASADIFKLDIARYVDFLVAASEPVIRDLKSLVPIDFPAVYNFGTALDVKHILAMRTAELPPARNRRGEALSRTRPVIAMCGTTSVRKGTDLLIRDAVLGRALAQTLGQKPAALMRGHGSVVVGENLPRAVGRSIYLEQSARMQMQAMALAGPGGRITYFDQSEVDASVARQDYHRAWPLWRAKALKRR
jgi:ribulose-5-phosphate 4-epimerase/fuculose-1-phosphate aldolase